MAIAGFSVKTGGTGKAVAHAAYLARTGAYEKLLEKGEVLEATGHGNMPAWAEHNPSLFWTAADAHERKNGTTYREFLISLPRELSSDERHALVKEFVAQELGDVHAYQYAIHVPRASDGLDNPHVHLMFSERRLDGIERDPEQYFKRYNAKQPELGGARKGYGEQPGAKLTQVERADALKALRSRWEDRVNSALERAGKVARVNMKSYADRGLDIQPEPKQLPSAWRREGKAAVLEFRAAREAEMAARCEPSAIVERVSGMKALFTRGDLYRELSRVTDDAEQFAAVKAQLDVEPSLVPLAVDGGRVAGSSNELLTTQRVLETEQSLTALGDVLSEKRTFGLSESVLDKALKVEPRLSDEQIAAVRHVTGDGRLALVSGVAGAGKSTMLSVVKSGYEQAGYRVSGMALAGKAADELRQSSGIASRTIASFLYRQSVGELTLTPKDVLVLDEAGMVHNGTMERVLDAVNRAGAKAILVGDAEQLQPIQAGCPFRSLSDAHGVAEISTVRRQRVPWQREATQALARGEGKAALSAYAEAGYVHSGGQADLLPQLVENYLSTTEGSAVILTHRNVDVAMLNSAVRDARMGQGELSGAREFSDGLELAVGDRVVFTQNDARIGVLNGQFGEVTGFAGSRVEVRLDAGNVVSFSAAEYADVKHGYASTIHKSQGMTVDRALVWGSSTLDRHLGYVAMSRHRDRLDVYQSDEANRVRSLAACLSRSTRTVTVDAMVREQGLGVEADTDGRVRLARQYPTARAVEQVQVELNAAQAHVRSEIASRLATLEQVSGEAAEALRQHREQEPSKTLLKLAVSPSALTIRQDWENALFPLKVNAQAAIEALDTWKQTISDHRFESGLVRTRFNKTAPDALSLAGGVERQTDGSVVLTAQYPAVARSAAQSVLDEASLYALGYVRDEQLRHERSAKRAEHALEQHLRREPTDSKWAVFLYQGPLAAREAWDRALPALQAQVDETKEALRDWAHQVKHEKLESTCLWARFAERAPDAFRIGQLTLSAERERTQYQAHLRQYHRVEKALESTLGRSLKQDYQRQRSELVERFSRHPHPERLPLRLQSRVIKHEKTQAKERAHKRSRSRGSGHGLGR